MSQELDNTEQEKMPEENKSNKQEFDVEGVMARMEKLEATNNRLLEESKSWKGKYRELSSDVETRQKAELEKSENWKDLLEIEKNKRSEYEQQLRETRKAVLQKELSFKVASVAKDAHDVNDVIQSLPKDIISIDEENLSINGVDEAVNRVRETKHWLFHKDNRSGMASGRPEASTGKKDYEDLSDNEKNDLFGSALSQLF